MSAKRRRRKKKNTNHWSGAVILGIVAIVLLVGFIGWGLLDQTRQPNEVTGGLPTPIGFPDTAQDVNSMVGQPAPDFTLQDETGQPVTVLPGQSERPIVLIFNMGLG